MSLVPASDRLRDEMSCVLGHFSTVRDFIAINTILKTLELIRQIHTICLRLFVENDNSVSKHNMKKNIQLDDQFRFYYVIQFVALNIGVYGKTTQNSTKSAITFSKPITAVTNFH